MRSLFLLTLLLSFTSLTFAQSKSEIIKHKIEVQRTYGQNLKDGDKDKYIDKEEFFDEKGELIEIKEYSDKGSKIKLWFRYKFDQEGNLIEETELDPKGNQITKMVYKYKDGLKTERLEYDNKDRVVKKRTYEYKIRK